MNSSEHIYPASETRQVVTDASEDTTSGVYDDRGSRGISLDELMHLKELSPKSSEIPPTLPFARRKLGEIVLAPLKTQFTETAHAGVMRTRRILHGKDEGASSLPEATDTQAIEKARIDFKSVVDAAFESHKKDPRYKQATLVGDEPDENAGIRPENTPKTPFVPRVDSDKHQPRGAQTSRPERRQRNRIQDSYELGLMYLSGELNKDGKQPPSMSPESLASKYVSYFGLHREKVAAGMDERLARQRAQEEILPLATEHFRKMQTEGLIAQDYVKIDPDDPANDIRITGHKVSPKNKVQKALSSYREQRAN